MSGNIHDSAINDNDDESSQVKSIKSMLDIEESRRRVTFQESVRHKNVEYETGHGCIWKNCSIRPSMLRYCCVTGGLAGALFGWDTGAYFGIDFSYYFGFTCRPEEPDCVLTYTAEDKQRLDSIMIAIVCIGEVFGSLFVATIMFDIFGRKKTLFAGGACYLVGSIIQASSISIGMLYAFRFLSSVGLGILNMVAPLYISEVAPIHRRGQLTSIWYIGATLGLIFVSLWNIFTNQVAHGWRISYIGDIILSTSFLICVVVVPESHYFFYIKNQKDKAKEVLRKIRPTNYGDGLNWELKEIEKEVKRVEEGKKFNFFSLRLFYGCLIQAIHEFSGIQSITTYVYVLVASVYGGKQAEAATVAIYCFNLIASVACFFTIERIGRPMILFTGGLVSFVVLSCGLYASVIVGVDGYRSTGDVGFFLLLFVWYLLGFSYSWGTVSWVYCTEIFDIEHRGISVGITTSVQAISTAVIQTKFINYVTLFPQAYECGTFIGVSAFGCLFAYFLLPETSNKTRPEIRKEFEKHRPVCLRLDFGPN